MGVASVADLLVCPQCRTSFAVSNDYRSLRCRQGHAFDIARQGYVNLRGQSVPQHADTAAMVGARDRFLASGHYRPMADALLGLAGDPGDRRLLDVGTGTGYYLARLLDGLPGARGVGLDISVAAVRRAARAHLRLGAVVADAWQPIPLADASMDVVLNVFAPRNVAEFARVLAPTGVLLSVIPDPDHLVEVRSALGLLDIQADKQARIRDAMGGAFTQLSEQSLSYRVRLQPSELVDLVAMGPNAFHLSDAELTGLAASVPAPITVSVAVRISAWGLAG